MTVDQHVPPPGPLMAAAPLGPDSLAWRLGLSRASLLLGGRALFLQVSHPIIGVGVRDFSTFRSDPWGRLDRTLTSLLTQLFGGADAVAEARRLRAVHASITGSGFDGKRYRALDPEAYAWVHLSNFDTVVTYSRFFARPLSEADEARYYAEWRQAGLVLGVRNERMPADLAGLGPYLDDMIAHRLDNNETVAELLGTLSLHDVPPPSRLLPPLVWNALRPMGGSVLHDLTVGTLPPALRHKLGLAWSDRQQRRLEQMAAAIRTATPLIPDRALQYPLAYRAQRAAQAYQRQARS
ncbi:MAG: oxygenase MpaB family protein [Acidimicrobiales bacterium]